MSVPGATFCSHPKDKHHTLSATAERKTFNKFTPNAQLINIYATKKGQQDTISLKQQFGTEIYSKLPLFFLCIAYS